MPGSSPGHDAVFLAEPLMARAAASAEIDEGAETEFKEDGTDP